MSLVCALEARADNTADEADIAFALGNKHYSQRSYEPALSQYFLSYRLVPNRNVLFNIAHCYEALNRFDEAYRYYYDLSVEASLKEADRKDIRASLARLAPRVALLSVTSEPPGAEFFIDREDLGSRGKTPQTVAVPPGAHTVVLKLPGYHPSTAKVVLVKGKEIKQAITIERIVGRVELTGTPVGAIIRETSDGPELGRLPATLSLVPGPKLLVVQAEGFTPTQVLIDVKPSLTVTSSVALIERTKPVGKVILTANRENALVRVDGKDSGFTPTVLTLPAGPHHIEISSEEAVSFVREVQVVADSEERLDAELRYAPPPVRAASKTALSVDQAPASVTVITREEIQSFGYQTLPEALRAVRGFFFTDDHIYTYMGVRGFSPPGDLNTRILVLYDGHPTNDAWAGQGYSSRDFDVDLNEVDRIEVVRGPASLLFGTGALFGVINVVPRERLSGSRNVEGSAGTGALNGVKARITGSAGDSEKSILASIAGFTSTGTELTQITGSPDVVGLDGERVLGGSVRAKWGGFTLSSKINQRRKQIPTGPYSADIGVPGTQYTDVRGFAELRYEKDLGRVTINGRASYDASRFRGYYARADLANPTDIVRDTDTGGGDWLSAEARVGIGLWSGNRLTVVGEGGGQFLYMQSVGVPAPVPLNRFLVSGTLLDEWQITPWLFVQAGVRLDKYFDLPSPALSPRAAVVLKPYASGVTKLVAGQAFRAPNIYELNFNDGNSTQRTPLPGSLLPELITTFEIEHSHDITPEFRATVGGYFNLIDRLVVTDPPENAPVALCGVDQPMPVQCIVYHNQPGTLTALGAEAQLRWQPGRFTLVDASYSFVYLSDLVAVYPTHMAALRALVPLREGLVKLSTQVTYQSGRKDDAGNSTGESVLINVGFSGEYGRVRYFAGVQNLLDQRYGLPVKSESGNLVVSQYGRTFWLELSAGL